MIIKQFETNDDKVGYLLELVEELFAREVTNNCPNSSLRGITWDELCDASIQLLKELKVQVIDNMKYVHYWHFNKRWYALVDDMPIKKDVYWHNCSYVQDYWNKEYLIEGADYMTHREVKNKLVSMYPNYILIKDKSFHEGRRWFGNKGGSRH